MMLGLTTKRPNTGVCSDPYESSSQWKTPDRKSTSSRIAISWNAVRTESISSFIIRALTLRAGLDPDILVPELRPRLDKIAHQLDAIRVLQNLELHPLRLHIFLGSLECHILADHD